MSKKIDDKKNKINNNKKENISKEKKASKVKLTKEEKIALKKERKTKRDYLSLKKKSKVIAIICISIIVIELLVMYIMNLVREDKITYIDTLYSIENINDEYYIAAGASNFRYSRYNEPFTFEYEDGIMEGQINTAYAEQAKFVKYDKELNVVFEKTFETDYDSTFYDVALIDDGYIAVGSYVFDKKQLSINTRDGLIVKYDLDGNFKWSKNYQVLGDTEFKKILIEEDGFIVIGQSIYENAEIGNHDQGGGIILKYDFDGNIIWKNNWGGNKSGIFNDIVKVSDGYIVCGKDARNFGLLVKYDFEGKAQFVKNYSNTDEDGMTRMLLKDDKLYIASSYNKSEEVDSEGNKKFEYDACIFVYDLDGELLDTFTIGGNKLDRFNSLLLLDDRIVAVGYTKSSDIEIDNLNYQENKVESILVEFNYDGKILNKTIYGGMNNEILNDITPAILKTEDKINNTKPFIVVGYSNTKFGLFEGNGKDYYSKILKYSKELELLEKK